MTGVKNNVGPDGEDAVTTVAKTVFVPKTPETFSYDLDGNLTGDAKWTYGWDAENRLVSMETTTTAAAAGLSKQRLEFAYDASGRRIAKKVYGWNTYSGSWLLTSDTRFLYDGWNLIAEVGASGSLVRSYVWGSDLSGSMQGAGGVGGLLTVTTSSAGYFPAYDGNGNILGLVNASTGTLDAEYEYSPFGETIKAYGSAAASQPFGFSSKYTDQETSFCYYGLRYYNPSTGRWLSRDPLGTGGGPNEYGFIYNDPLNWWDILGLVPPGSALRGDTPVFIEVMGELEGAGPKPFPPVPAPILLPNQNTNTNTNSPAIPRTQTDTKKEECKKKRCRECTPKRGTVGYMIVDVTINARIRGAHKGTDPINNHLKTWQMNQIPLGLANECRCIWNQLGEVNGTLTAPKNWYLLTSYPIPGGPPPTGGGVEYY